MNANVTSLNLKVEKSTRDEFASTARSLGMTSSAALKVLVTAFIESGGFPFELRTHRIDHDNPDLIRPEVRDGLVVMPTSWRDEDDDD